MKRIPAAGVIGEVALREAAATELRQVIDLVRGAVMERDPNGSYYEMAMYADRAVYSRRGRMFAIPYSLSAENIVELGAEYEVVIDHRPVKDALREALNSDWFVEAEAAEEGKPSRYHVCVIQSGLSKNGVNYPVAVLREAVSLFNNVRVFVKDDDVHVKGGGKDFRQLVGRLVEAKFTESKGIGKIIAVLEVLDTADVAPKLREAVQRGMTDLFGLSIDADGTSKSTGNKLREAVKLLRVSSVDLIIEPGAGGQVIRFAESHHQEPDMLRQKMLDKIRSRDANRATQLESASDEEVMTAYREAVDAEALAKDKGTEDIATQVANATATAMRMVEARADARAKISNSKLPQAAKDRLVQRFTEAADVKAADVDSAITAETDYVNSFREAAPITGLGVTLKDNETMQDRIQADLDGFFEGNGKGFKSFREAYVTVTGDTHVTGRLESCDITRLAEASGSFREAVSAATWGNVLGNSIARQMLRAYNDNPLYGDWRWLVDIVNIRDFRSNERTRTGGYGNMPAVAENGGYAALTTPTDEKAAYAVTKRGGIETISLEAIANDDANAIRRIPQQMGMAAARTLYEFVFDFMRTNALVYDGVALAAAGHNNLGVAALGAASFAASRLRMQKQTDFGSTKRLGLVLRHVVVPAELEELGFDMFVRGTNNDETFVQSRKPTVHVSPYWTDTNDFWCTADKSQVPLIELGFFGGNEEPEVFIQDNPTQGSLFSNDQLKYKLRHIYGGSVLDYRGFDGNIVP